jgi:hypothetical protein
MINFDYSNLFKTSIVIVVTVGFLTLLRTKSSRSLFLYFVRTASTNFIESSHSQQSETYLICGFVALVMSKSSSKVIKLHLIG